MSATPLAARAAIAIIVAGFSARAGSAEIRHSFLAFGAETKIVGENGSTEWTFPEGTRDGWVLPNGRFLLTLTRSDKRPGGAVVEVDRAGRAYFEYDGTQSEVNTSQRLANGNTVLTEAGAKPRLLELDPAGKIVIQFPIQCQLTNFHMQTRMTRKLANGNYLIPQLLDKTVREYRPDGMVAWEAPTPNWAFTAIRLKNGNTLVGCTRGNEVIELNPKRKIVWRLSNDDFAGNPINDACGVQRLANGNTVVTSYGIGENRRKLTEVTPDKKLVWTYTDAAPHGIHEFQILTTNGKPEPLSAMR